MKPACTLLTWVGRIKAGSSVCHPTTSAVTSLSSGGRIVFAYTSLYPELSTCKGSFKDSERHARACRGSFLFLDLPDLMPNMTHGLPADVSREFVLYTTHDVLFLKDVDSCKVGSPKVCSAPCHCAPCKQPWHIVCCATVC